MLGDERVEEEEEEEKGGDEAKDAEFSPVEMGVGTNAIGGIMTFEGERDALCDTP